MNTKTKIIIVIVAAVLVIAAVGAGIFWFAFGSNSGVDTEQTEENVNVSQKLNNTNNGASSSGSTKSSTKSNNTSNTSNKNANNTSYDPEKNSIDRDPKNYSTKNRENELIFEQRSAQGMYTADDDFTLDNVDQNQLKSTASSFLYGYLGFTSAKIQSGEYPHSYMQYCDEAYVSQNTDSDLYLHQTGKWLNAVASYSETYSNAVSVEPVSVYISHAEPYTDMLAVRCTVILDANRDYWGNAGWETVDEYKCSYAVYFNNQTGEVIDVCEQKKDAIAFNVQGSTNTFSPH